MPVIPILSVLGCLFVMINLPLETWYRFLAWMVVGSIIYFGYGRHHSRVGIAAASGRS